MMFPLRAICLGLLLLVMLSGGVFADESPELLPGEPVPVEEPIVTEPEIVLPAFDTEITPDMSLSYSSPAPVVAAAQAEKVAIGKKPNNTAKFVERAAIVYLFDRTTNEFTKSSLSGSGASKAADLFNGFGSKQMVGLLGLGYVIGGPSAKRTYGTAIEAAGEAMLITEGLKFLTGRMRPRDAGGDPNNFEGPGSGYASFPSGHVSNAFAVATVFAHKNPKKKWLYYTLAAGVAYARMQKQAHFGSDVFVGAAIGAYAGKKAVKGKSLMHKLH